MTKYIWADMRDIASEGARYVIEGIRKVLRKKGHVVLGLCGGRSVSGIFQDLLKIHIDWYKVHIFMVDERMVPITHEDSNFRLAYENFLQELIEKKKMPESHIHPFLVDKSNDPVKAYEDELKSLGGEYDVLLLSSGEDGHIGALFPNHHSIMNDTPYFVKMNDSPKPPSERVTISKTLLLKAKSAVILFVGEGKRQAFEDFKNESLKIEDCPARLVHQIPDSVALTDLKVSFEI